MKTLAGTDQLVANASVYLAWGFGIEAPSSYYVRYLEFRGYDLGENACRRNPGSQKRVTPEIG